MLSISVRGMDDAYVVRDVHSARGCYTPECKYPFNSSSHTLKLLLYEKVFRADGVAFLVRAGGEQLLGMSETRGDDAADTYTDEVVFTVR